MGTPRSPRPGRSALVAAAIALWLGVTPGTALAAPITLIDVSGAGTTGQAINLDQGAVVSFTLDQAYTNVAISADLICVGCLGEVVLMRDLIGPTSTLANFVTGDFFDPTSSVDPLLSGLSLSAGTYFLIVAITDSGGAVWTGSEPFDLTAAPGVTMGLNFFAQDVDDSVSYKSPFSTIPSSAGLHFTVVGETRETSVPEPAVMTLLLLAGAGVIQQRRRRRQEYD
jgi:hypothetical protein